MPVSISCYSVIHIALIYFLLFHIILILNNIFRTWQRTQSEWTRHAFMMFILWIRCPVKAFGPLQFHQNESSYSSFIIESFRFTFVHHRYYNPCVAAVLFLKTVKVQLGCFCVRRNTFARQRLKLLVLFALCSKLHYNNNRHD